ncbi:hypothetical protein LUZ61_019468 [Rhynchospora tenuis]|uniref:Uncharacterized protein n=1 Tax=Rhynchospora tenuis TaxID=198213 RepID=A0AAD6EMW2_9POAL|nr:hypothetical protein LUZ61_019468 [Rhynchospora tenuis]
MVPAEVPLDSVVELVSNIITKEIGLLLGVRQELSFIKEELEMMRAFLRAASTENVKSGTVSTWIKQVQELAFDVEDCLQEALVHLPKKSCLPALCSAKKRDSIARKIRVLKGRIEDVSKRNLRYELIKSSGTENHDRMNYQGTSTKLTANDEALLVGLDEPTRELVELILREHVEQKVISVVGMSGLGKTTLVRKVYSSQDLTNQFEFSYWVSLFHPFDQEGTENLQKEILEILGDYEKVQKKKQTEEGKKKIVAKEVEDRKRKLTEHLEGKKYVIVLDNLSKKSEWDTIEPMLPKSKGSRIIVTTRSKSLAEHISHSHENIYEMKTLSEDEAKRLFFKTVYNTSRYHLENSVGDKKEYPNHESNSSILQNQCTTTNHITIDMETQASRIIERCGRLPVAIVTIGSYLATKPKTSVEWKAMHDHLTSELVNNPNLDKVKTVLSSSYDGLPYHLKSCMLYLSVFHEHYEIRRTRIIRRWMADGYVMRDLNKTAEEVGEDYFDDLIGRSLIQPSEMTTNVSDDINRCKIHDMMYELIRNKSMEENVMSLLEKKTLKTMTDKVRHLVVAGEQSKGDSVLKELKLSHMRSLSIFGEVGDNLRYPRMKLLRVLDLEGTDLDNQSLKRIGKLRLLKYLGLRGTKVTKLPKSLRKLYELETLDVRNTAVVELPEGLTVLRKLSYLRAGFDFYENWEPMITLHQITQSTRLPLMCCSWLLNQTVEDKNFDSYGVRVPRGIRKLRSLSTLGMVDIGQSNGLVKELQNLINLRKLAVTGFSEKNGKTLANVIDGLDLLKSLVLTAANDTGLGCCLEAVSTPPKYLQSLKLYSPINKLPNWIMWLENLVKMEVRSTNLEMEEIKRIEKLPNLTILRMLRNPFKGQQLCFGPGAFPKLHTLKIELMKDLKSVSFEKSSAPRLENLEINGCRSLGQNGLSGLLFLERLKKISVEIWYEDPETDELDENSLSETSQALERELKDMVSSHENQPCLWFTRYE